MVIVDCGLAFPTDDMLGIDLVLPDFTFAERNADKIRALSLPTATRTTSAPCPIF